MSAPAIDISSLSADQQAALEQYTAVTNQEVEAAIPLLQRTQWNVQIAITQFFDGGPPPDPLEPTLNEPPRDPQRQDTLANGFTSSRPSRIQHLPPAPRVVPNPNSDVTYNPGFPLSAVFWILGQPWNLLVRTFRFLSPFVPFISTLLGRLQSTSASRASARRPLKPRDAAARFIREFEEEYGSNQLPFLETGYAQSLDQAKRDLKYLLVIIISPEHDDTAAYARDTLLSPDVVSFLRNQENILLWAGTVQDSEAYQIADAFGASKFPFAALISNTPPGASSGTRSGYAMSTSGMSIIAPLAGLLPPSELLSKIRHAIEKHAPILSQLRSERAERDSVRSLREQQDSAYERSLARDRERAQQKREQEERQKQQEAEARKAEGEKEHAAQNLELWKLWRASRMHPTPPAGSRDAVNVRIKLPGGGMEVRRFDGGLDVEEIYAFVECKDILDSAISKEASEPKDFKHEYPFRLVSPIPRVEYDLETSGSIRERVGRNATLHVETIDDE